MNVSPSMNALQISPALQSAAMQSSVGSKATGNDLLNGKDPATEFEAVMLSLLVSQMRKTGSEEGLFPGDKSDTMGGMFDMFIGQQLAESGSLGIKDLVKGWMKDRGAASTGSSETPGQPHAAIARYLENQPATATTTPE